jgi:hypothetical protein
MLPQERREIVERANGYLYKPLRAKKFLETVCVMLEREYGGRASQPSEKGDLPWWMFWFPWRRQAAPVKTVSDSERR